MQKNDWPIFGCKVGQSAPIGMKLELDAWHHLLNVYTNFEIDILKHLAKTARQTSKNPKGAKIMAKILKMQFLQKKRNLCREVFIGPPMYQI